MSDIFKLSTPLLTHKGQVTEIELGAPKAKSFIRYGVPFNHIIKGEGETQTMQTDFNMKAVFGFISDMTGIDEILLGDLDARDVMPLCWKLVEILNRPTAAVSVPQT